MKSVFLVFLFSISVNSQNPEMMYPQNNFDSDSCCWRQLAASGKYDEAANLIVDYLNKGKPQNKQSLKWHAGQMFAMAQNNKMALHYFNKSSTIFSYWLGGQEGKSWYLYVHGVKAFIRRDQEKLTRIIKVWDNKLSVDLNYKQLVLLLHNWNQTYLEALK